MKARPVPLIIILVLISFSVYSQQDSVYRLLLKGGSFIPTKNISAEFLQQFNKKMSKTQGEAFSLIQFEHIPTDDERNQLQRSGITLLDYIPNNAYTVNIKGAVNENLLQKIKARAFIELRPEQKMPLSLAMGVIPPWAVKVQGTVDVWIRVIKTMNADEAAKTLRENNFDIVSSDHKNFRILSVRVPLMRLNELSGLPFIEYVQPAPHEDQPLNNVDRSNTRANILNSATSVGGRNLKGEGIVIGVGDNADPQLHIDFANRLITRTFAPPTAEHGKHVAGTAAGAGIMNELFKGIAPKAKIVTQYFSGIWLNAANYVQDYGMVITNNSYGAIVDDCTYSGVYDLYSVMLDEQAFDLPFLQNIFSSGNSGLDNCAPYPAGYKTVLGSYQSAKNVLTVGATDSAGNIGGFSSKGPVKDGRLKPEIAAMGDRVISAGFGSYWYNSGTSMASPGITGGMTLLYQLYKEKNGGSNPASGLMKAIVCNTGRDIASTGPDFSSGFGWLDLQRAAITIENNRYLSSTVANGVQNPHTIAVPANAAQLKIMLYWHDPPASLLSSQALVNDLDLSVQIPAGTTVRPKILDTVPSNILNPTTEGADHINNIEQVVINNPQAGNYIIKVNGTSITQNSPQQYFVAYDFVPDSTRLTFPIGGESFSTTDSAIVQWDAFGNAATFTLKYSIDNGANWLSIDNAIPGNLRQKKWVLPNTTTDIAKIQLTNNVTAAVSESNAFTILGQPVVTFGDTLCECYIKIKWPVIPNATDYEVMMLRGDDMQPMAVTTDTFYVFNGLSKDSVYWVGVRARLNGHPGRRSLSISKQPNMGTCLGTISDNDLKVDALPGLVSGRKFTSTELGNAVQIKIRVKNLDNTAISNYDIEYSVNGGSWVTQNIAAALNGGDTITHQFIAAFDFSPVGIYIVRAVVHYPSDPVRSNDTMTVTIKQLDNQPINLTSDFTENFDAAPVQEFNTAQVGLGGLDRFDFTNSTVYGRLRSFINSGVARSGNNAISLDVDRYIYPSTNTNYLEGSFNLSGYNATNDDIRMDFYFNNHGQPPGASNKVWIRGSDTSPWIAAYDLFANQNDPGTYKKSSSVELSDILAGSGQNFTTSFQVRWGEFGFLPAVDRGNAGGYTFDDVHLYVALDDIQMISIDTPIVSSCALSATTPVRVSVRNSANTTVNLIPVKYRIDGGPAIIVDTIPSIAANTTLSFTFSVSANLGATGNHTVETWVDFPTDSYRANDSSFVSIVNSAVVNSFPYLENFEAGNGAWYTGGLKSSWEYGTPASNKIDAAASGSKIWKTSLAGNYNDLEFSYLYSPCFDITGMTTPTLSFSVALDMEDCGASLCDGGWVEYSADGITWNKLGTFGSGTNWYNKNYAGAPLWSVQNYTRWHVATTVLPAGLSRLRLRFVMSSDPAVNREGIAVDDIHIYDNTLGIYTGATMGAPVNQNIPGGNSWIDFTSGGKLVASIQPNGQNLGSTDVRAFINAAAVRHTATQYYHNRNITIIPTNALTDSVTVRYYFLDTETEALLNASSCPSCTKPRSAYELGVSKYTDPATRANEDGSLANDTQGNWFFITSSKAPKVPFDRGYYVEFKVRDFSEFWLNNGGLSGSLTLPVKFLEFTASRQPNSDVVVAWKTAEEKDIDRYEIEVARSAGEYQSNHFEKIGQVSALGNSSASRDYSFTDAENYKSGTRYYRLKIIEADGSFHYSATRSVIFDNDVVWQVYPNPSEGIFHFVFQQTSGTTVDLKVYDIKGQLVEQVHTVATGFVQKLTIDIQQSKFAKGMYMIIAKGEETKTFKVVKQ